MSEYKNENPLVDLDQARATAPELTGEHSEVMQALIREVEALRAANHNWQRWADNLPPRCCCGNCEDL